MKYLIYTTVFAFLHCLFPEKSFPLLITSFVVILAAYYWEYTNGRAENEQEALEAEPPAEKQEDVIDYPVFRQAALHLSQERVIESIYRLYISTWYSVPETLKDQPLYNEIRNIVAHTCSNLKVKTQLINNYELILITAKALIDHMKKTPSKKTLTSKEEVDFLRQQARLLLASLLPQSLTGSDVIMIFLTEIVAVKGLETNINLLSDPEFINQSIVAYLENNKQPETEQPAPQSDASSQQESENNPSEPVTPTLFSIEDMYKSGRAKSKKKDLALRRIENPSDDVQFKSLISKLCQMWKEKNWTATITEIADKVYRIKVSNKDKADKELWDVIRNLADFQLVYDKVLKERPTSTCQKSNDNIFISTFQRTPDLFINELVDQVNNIQCQEALIFLSPFEYRADGRDPYWDLLKDLQNNEDLLAMELDTETGNNPESMTSNSNDDTSDVNSGPGLPDGVPYKMLKLIRKRKVRNNVHSRGSENPSPAEDVTPQTERVSSPESSRLNIRDNLPSTTPDEQGDSIKEDSEKMKRNKQLEIEEKKREKKLQKETFAVLLQLADKIIGWKCLLQVVYNMGLLKKYKKMFYQLVPSTLKEEHFVWGLEQINTLLQSINDPSISPSGDLQSKAKELLIKKVKSLQLNKLLSGAAITFLKNLQEAFQDQKRNKQTLLNLFRDLSQHLTGSEQRPTI